MIQSFSAIEPLFVSAQLPSPYRLEVIATTKHFAAAYGRERASVAAGLRHLLDLRPESPLVFAGQTHGSAVVNVDRSLQPRVEYENYTLVKECDGLATGRLETAVVVRTADCVPLVFSSSRQPWVAVVHAGWRGTLAGITKKTMDLAKACGIQVSSLNLWVGPHITGDVYEVSPELAREFEAKFKHLGNITSGRYLDLGQANSLLARECGVAEENISCSPHCTFSEPGLFPSYRRDGECRGQIYTVAILRR